MRELNIDISGQRSKPLAEFEGQTFDFVITVCDKAREECPMFSTLSSRETGESAAKSSGFGPDPRGPTRGRATSHSKRLRGLKPQERRKCGGYG